MRRFRVDASKKIVAAVDYDSSDYLSTVIAPVIGSFADSKFKQVADRINGELRTIAEEYQVSAINLGEALINACPHISARYKQVESIFPDVYYYVEECGEATWIYLETPLFNSNRYNEFLDKLDQQGYYTDRGNFVCDLHDKHVELWVPHGHATGEAIAYCLDEMGMPAPNGVDFLSGDLPEIYKQFIDDYCKFIINYCEKRIDIALTSYII